MSNRFHPLGCLAVLAAGFFLNPSLLRGQLPALTITKEPSDPSVLMETIRVPAGPLGWHQHGFRTENDGTIDLRVDAGLVVELKKDRETPLDLEVTLRIPPVDGRQEYIPQTTAKVRVIGSGKQRLFLPWSAFDFQQATPAFLKFIQTIELKAQYADGKAGVIEVLRVQPVRGEFLALDTDVRSHALPAAGKVSYPVTVYNCADAAQSIALSLQHYGWEAMAATVTPDHLDLAAGAEGVCTVTVDVPDKVPPGGQEKQILQAVANGQSVVRLELLTARDVAHPYLLHTAAGWQDVRDKVKKYPWAKETQDKLVAEATKWQVPEMTDPKTLRVTDGLGPYLFRSEQAHACGMEGIAWQLTGNRAFAEKAALFLRRVSDPITGYASTLRGSQQGLVHEGECFAAMASAYDLILDAKILTDADRAQIDQTFRLLIETMDFDRQTGGVSNWGVDEYTGGLFCSLMVGDLERAWRFYSGPTGILDQAGKGILDDGWWFECSVNYNSGMAHAFTAVSVALEPWGIDLKDKKIPANFSKNYSLVPWAMQPGLYGMAFEKWGPNTRSYRQIRDLWDGFLPFVDYRGIMFGTNDSDEKEISGGLYELAYYVFRDPKYAAMVKFSPTRDLLWSVPELPKDTPEFYRVSTYADNAGIAVLRSQTPDRPPREQIQAVLKYGTHGGYHGHFDRISLLSLMRYGRSFFHPEMAWYGYNPPLYKFWGQTSIDKNMVVVDDKMQEPVESKRLLFHSGPKLQVVAAETRARWSNPPFMGGMIQPKGQTWDQVVADLPRWLALPKDPPSPLAITGYTEPVLQRRLLAVTDDYVVIADYLKADQEHTFDNLLQIKGFRGITAPESKLARHTAQLNGDPLNSAQFITDCDWYDVKGPALARFEMVFGKTPASDGLGERNVPGPLKMDVYSAWPEQREILIATTPVNLKGTGRQVRYRARIDGAEVATGKFGAWVIGEGDLDLPVEGQSTLELEVQAEASAAHDPKSLFWANVRAVTADGKEIPIPASAIEYVNTVPAPPTGQDYAGGPIKIAGTLYPSALPAEPTDLTKPSLLRIDLKKLGAVRFKAVVGSDYPIGDESSLRKTFAVRTTGKEARFLTVIESREGEPVIQSVQATSADELLVTLKNGRQQRLTIKNLEADPSAPQVTLEELHDGQVTATESISSPQ